MRYNFYYVVDDMGSIWYKSQSGGGIFCGAYPLSDKFMFESKSECDELIEEIDSNYRFTKRENLFIREGYIELPTLTA